jgi:triosephosphate isomerase (TIM)
MTPPLVVGNWKANGLRAEHRELARAIARGIMRKPAAVEVALAPPYIGLTEVKRVVEKSAVKLAAQNCHWEDKGAFTGEITPPMLADAGCDFVIVGHSERRHIFHESDAIIAGKLQAALRHRLRPILCIGETLAERQAGRAGVTITRQLRIALKGLAKNAIENIEIAYEPVWAIGTGHNATSQQISRVHERIRKFLTKSFDQREGNSVRILYGGSVNPGNALEILKTAEVNGLLVGGASLKAETFLPIVHCLG